jgi:hypothetical protein
MATVLGVRGFAAMRRFRVSFLRLRSRFLLNSFWRQLLTHYKARTEALCERIEKSPIDVNGSKARGTFVAQFAEDRLAVQR